MPRAATACAVSFFLSWPALAQLSTEPGVSLGPDPGGRGPITERGESFGTSDQSVTWLPMASFQPRSTAGHEMSYAGQGSQSRTGGTDLLWATLDLPNGAVVDSITLFANDSSDTGDAIVLFARFQFPSGFDDLGFASTAGSPGPTQATFAPAYVIDNANNAYVIYIDLPVDANLSARGVRVLWRRQVSPAPATATFADVPVTHLYFRAIEAMAAAGITGGCGNGNFCPDQSITRGETAAFFARALGLHHPY
jgi:hypothetical protein